MLNSVNLQGRLTRDPELRFATETGNAVCRFSIAVEGNYKNKNGEYITAFIPCVAFGKTAENVSKYFVKGSMIILSGSILMNKYVKDEKTVTALEIKVDSFNFAGEARRKDGTKPDMTSDEEKPAEPVKEQEPEQEKIDDSEFFPEVTDVDDADLPF